MCVRVVSVRLQMTSGTSGTAAAGASSEVVVGERIDECDHYTSGLDCEHHEDDSESVYDDDEEEENNDANENEYTGEITQASPKPVPTSAEMRPQWMAAGLGGIAPGTQRAHMAFTILCTDGSYVAPSSVQPQRPSIDSAVRPWDDEYVLKRSFSALIPAFDPRPGRTNVNQTQVSCRWALF